MNRSTLLKALVPAITLAIAGCAAVGPDYKRPSDATPASFKEAGENTKGQPLPPMWWDVFGDAKLNDLEEQARASSPNLRAAASRVVQARAIAGIAESQYFPEVSLDPSVSRSRYSGNRPAQPGTPVAGYSATDFRLPLDASYEIDVWGRVRRQVEAANARLDATADDYFTVLLTLQADIAQTYFSLRSLDAEIDVLRHAIDIRKQALDLISVRYEGGVGSELDVTRARTELAQAESDLIGVAKNRARLEHALAILVGKAPADFTLAENPLNIAPPQIPVGLPSELLLRRPDVAKAERLLAARNADIGVAQAAYFPTFSLTGTLGFESARLGDLLKSDSRMGGIGAGFNWPILDFGRIKGNVDLTKAAYEENLAQYRGQVLTAFGDVEDALSDLRILADQAQAQSRALTAAQQSAQISITRYEAGLVIFLEVVDAERTRLQTQRLATQIDGQRLFASVGLIKALGGGWEDMRASQTKVSSAK
ncbi:MAG TPA: efflux transporter outer membrane subunit [Burkholderiales bacterium]|nr:efflux transporter outer membrane subunit [Burkholderiales bacterium]